jgi:hypothetical protein
MQLNLWLNPDPLSINNCVPISALLLGIINEQQYHDTMRDRGWGAEDGLTTEEVINLLQRAEHGLVEEIVIQNFNNFCELIPKGYGCVLLYRINGAGHAVVLGKTYAGLISMFDPQTREAVQGTPEHLMEYFNRTGGTRLSAFAVNSTPLSEERPVKRSKALGGKRKSKLSRRKSRRGSK